MRRIRLAKIVAVAVTLVVAGAGLSAQLRVRPVGELPGDITLRLLLRKLATAGTFMETDAHPDDEDNALLAQMSHGRGFRTVLVTATRGDGGQNEIGPELFQALGILRTEELAAVHRYDGAAQYFSRAYEFGYSFSVEETFKKWGHDETLGDVVQRVRAFQPDVILTLPLEAKGGGQHHQAAARLAVEAFRAAADPARFPEQLTGGLAPWQACKVYEGGVGGGRDTISGPPPVTMKTSVYDPLLGMSW